MTVLGQRKTLGLPLPIVEARNKRALVAKAELINHSQFQGLSDGFRKRLRNSTRLVSRIHAFLLAEFGIPVITSVESRNFYLMTEDRLDDAALCLGLSYDLAMRGGILRGEVISRFNEFCDAKIMAKALRYAADVPASALNQDIEPPQKAVLIANGWSLLRIWADASGVNADWRISRNRTSEENLGSVSRTIACHLAKRVLAEAEIQSEAS